MARDPTLTRRAFACAALSALAACARRAGPMPAVETRRDPRSPSLEPATAASEHPPAPGAPASEPAESATVAEETLPLLRAYPRLGERLARVSLGLRLPTPVERAGARGRRLGVGDLWIKRDDLTGEEYGGGKPRKLELLLGRALSASATTVVTFGAVGSNHAVATALYARRVGLATLLLLLPQPPSDEVRRALLAARAANAEIALARGAKGGEAAARRLLAARDPGAVPWIIPAGGTSPEGNVGFVNAAFELAEQIEEGLLPTPSRIFLAMGTMGSAAGLAVGLRAASLSTKVVAVRASSPSTSSAAALAATVAATVDHLRGLDPSFPAMTPAEVGIRIEGRQLGGGYGVATAKGRAAVELAAGAAGLTLETTYTGKALAAIADDAAALAGETVLFWNTHSARPLDTSGVTPWDLPAELRSYFPRG